MRLHEMFYLIKKALDNWVNPEFTERKAAAPNPNLFTCSNRQEVNDELNSLKRFMQLDDTEQLLNELRFNSSVATFYSDSEVAKIRNSIARLHHDLQAMESMCITLGVKENASGFDVKLPDDISLEDLTICSKDLNTIFSQCPILNKENSKVKLSGVDVGSAWLTFTVICLGATSISIILNNLAALIDKAIILRSHWLTCKQQEEDLKKTKKGNELLDNVVEANKAIMEYYRGEAVNELSESHNITDNEDKERLGHSLKLLYELLGRGIEIYPAISAPTEVKAVFPPLETQVLPKSEPRFLKSESESTKS